MDTDQNAGNRRDFLLTAGKGILAAGLIGSLGATPLAPPDKQPANLPIPKPAQNKVGYAIVGLGELALGEVLPAFALSDLCAPVALVSGHRDKAEKVAAHYGITSKNIYNYENYDSIRENPDVQVIYIILPNNMHAEYTVRGFQAGKHVLCEKPMAPTVNDCRQMIDAGKAANKKLMIAYRLRYEPYNQTMIEMMRKQALGKIQMFTAENLQNTKAPNIRLSKQTAGGPLGDVGIYCLNAARYITGEEPVGVTGMAYADPSDERFREVPESVAFTLKFPSGVIAQCSCGFGSSRSDRYRVTCADGVMELDPAFGYTDQTLTIRSKDRHEILQIPHVNHFASEMDHFAECITKDLPVRTPGEEGLADMNIIAKIEQAISEGRTVKV